MRFFKIKRRWHLMRARSLRKTMWYLEDAVDCGSHLLEYMSPRYARVSAKFREHYDWLVEHDAKRAE